MKRISIAGFFLVALVCAPIARSQQSSTDQGGSTPATPDQPLPATDASSSSSKNDAGAAPAGRSIPGSDTTDQTQDATQPLSGSQQLGLVSGATPRNLFDVSGLFSGSADSAVINAQQLPGWGGTEVVEGSLSYDRTWNANQFMLLYTGGGIFYQPSALYPDSMYHSLSLNQAFAWQRFTLRLIDQFSYSPTTQFGGAGFGGPGLLAENGQATGSTLNPAYGSGSTILTGNTHLINNTAVAEIQYNLSRRSSFTVSGDYGLLDYSSGGYISSHDYVLGGGYNYSITAKDTVAVSYNFTQTHFTGLPESLDFQLVNASYSHQVTDRMVFQVAAGPEFITYRGYTPSVPNTLTWSVSTGLQYRWQRSSVGISYFRGANAGSGVFLGSIAQGVGANASHQFSRFLVGAVNVGYSDNNNLVASSVTENQFHNWYVGASVGRQLGRRAHISFNYGAIQQPYYGVCPVTSCGTNHIVQTIGVALDIHLRPIGSVE